MHILVTVVKMDAGPIRTKLTRKLDGKDHATELVTELFSTGLNALVEVLPRVWDKSNDLRIQDEAFSSLFYKKMKGGGQSLFS